MVQANTEAKRPIHKAYTTQLDHNSQVETQKQVQISTIRPTKLIQKSASINELQEPMKQLILASNEKPMVSTITLPTIDLKSTKNYEFQTL